jgi:ribosomal protein S14
MSTDEPAERSQVDGAAKNRIPRCGSCGQKVWKPQRAIFEEIGLCRQCALRELEPLANSLDDALCGDPETLVTAMGHTRASHYEGLLDLALKVYKAGWRVTTPAEPPGSPGHKE